MEQGETDIEVFNSESLLNFSQLSEHLIPGAEAANTPDNKNEKDDEPILHSVVQWYHA